MNYTITERINWSILPYFLSYLNYTFFDSLFDTNNLLQYH